MMKNIKRTLECVSCVPDEASNKNPSHERELKRINRIVGQLEGIGRMITDRRYCPEILVQTRAATAAIRSLEAAILQKHIDSCVAAAFSTKGKNRQEKIDELIELFKSR